MLMNDKCICLAAAVQAMWSTWAMRVQTANAHGVLSGQPVLVMVCHAVGQLPQTPCAQHLRRSCAPCCAITHASHSLPHASRWPVFISSLALDYGEVLARQRCMAVATYVT